MNDKHSLSGKEHALEYLRRFIRPNEVYSYRMSLAKVDTVYGFINVEKHFFYLGPTREITGLGHRDIY